MDNENEIDFKISQLKLLFNHFRYFFCTQIRVINFIYSSFQFHHEESLIYAFSSFLSNYFQTTQYLFFGLCSNLFGLLFRSNLSSNSASSSTKCTVPPFDSKYFLHDVYNPNPLGGQMPIYT